MHRVRLAVRENRLTRIVSSDVDYIAEIATDRVWVIEPAETLYADTRLSGFERCRHTPRVRRITGALQASVVRRRAAGAVQGAIVLSGLDRAEAHSGIDPESARHFSVTYGL